MRSYNAVKAFAPLFLPNEHNSLEDIGVAEYILKSGRVSGKTQHDEMAAVLDLLNGKGDIWYCRSEDNTIRGSIFTSMLNTISMLGFTYSNKANADFKVSYSPFEIKHNRTGNCVQFFGINKDINRSKGKIPPSGKLKRVMVEEANECDDGIYIDALITTAVRFFDDNSKLVFRLNPPLTKQHWSVAYFNKRERSKGYLHHLGRIGRNRGVDEINACGHKENA
ncbi:MAG: phage terminase large subunit [Clostridia bacterium]